MNNPWVSQIPKGWNYSTLQDVCSKIVDNRGKTVPTSEFGIPLIATNCIKNDKLFPTYERVRYVSKEIHENWFRGHPKPGDIIFVNKGTPGQVCFVPDPIDFCIAQDMVALRANEDLIYPKFLFTALRSRFFKTQVDAYYVGTMIPHLKKSSFNELVIPIPSPKIQKIIGDIYYQLSLQISNLEKMNFILEKIIQAIFKSWFVDFDGQTEFVNSELGQIPKGWNVSTIQKFCNTFGGGTPTTKKPEFWNGTINWATPTDLTKANNLFLYETARKITQSGFENCSSKLHPKNSILMTSRATIGFFAINVFPTAINQGFIVIEPKNIFDLYYLYCDFKNRTQEFITRANGTIFLEISRGVFRELPFLVPDENTLKKFHKLVEPFFKNINSNSSTISILSKFYDFLLPRLMSGEIRV